MALSEEDGPEDSVTTTEALAEDEEYMTRPRDRRQQRRRQGIDNGPEESTTMTEASAEEYEHEDFNKNNGGVGGGYMTRSRDQRQRQRRQRLDNRPYGLATTTKCRFYLLSHR